MMVLIACVDDRFGMAFHSRRQSRDRAVCVDIAALIAGAPVWMEEKSASLFADLGITVVTQGEPSEQAYCFVETRAPSSICKDPDRIVLYRWNRHYPADLRFDISLDGYCFVESAEFVGTSHEKITREVYSREKIRQ